MRSLGRRTKWKRPTRKAALTGLILLSLVLIVLENTGQRRIPYTLSHTLRPVLAPLGEATIYLTSHIAPAPMTNDERQAEFSAILVQVKQVINDQQQRINELRHWRDAMEGFPCLLIDGHVTVREGNPLRELRLVDVGDNRGVRPGYLVTTRRIVTPYENELPKGLAVLGSNYIIGVISDSAANTATVQLVTDSQFQMPATLYRMLAPGQQRDVFVSTPSGGLEKKTVTHDGSTAGSYPVGEPIPVLAKGTGKQIVLQQVPATHNIQPGDLLTTGPSTTNLLPIGLTIGRVVDCRFESKDPHHVDVYVEPLADLSNLENVYIVMPASRGTK